MVMGISAILPILHEPAEADPEAIKRPTKAGPAARNFNLPIPNAVNEALRMLFADIPVLRNLRMNSAWQAPIGQNRFCGPDLGLRFSPHFQRYNTHG